MPRVKFSVEQIIHKLREAEVLLAQGQTIKDICREYSIRAEWRKGASQWEGLQGPERRQKNLESPSGILPSDAACRS